ncbi:MAG TPA: GNAT family N-acetyltransferase [Micromonosporaceae bacterium]|nr:GNAT family N-acetyltransferase [Micromonosporaceae bacterium]
MTPFEVGVSGSNVAHDAAAIVALATSRAQPAGVPAHAPVGAIMIDSAPASVASATLDARGARATDTVAAPPGHAVEPFVASLTSAEAAPPDPVRHGDTRSAGPDRAKRAITSAAGAPHAVSTGHPPVQRIPSVPGGVFVGERFPHLTIATPRLHVRPHTLADADRVTEIFGDRLTQRWLPFSSEHGAINGRAWCGEMAAERRALGQGDHYAIVRREDEQLVGCVWTKRTDWPARSTEVSFALASEARGFGFAAEAIDGLAIELIMRHDFGRIELRVAPGNTGSRRVAEKAGFHYEGLLRNAGYVHSGRVDLEMWSLVAADLR